MGKVLFSGKFRRFIMVASYLLFVIYALYMIDMLFLGSYRYWGNDNNYRISYNLVPLRTITAYIVNFDHYNFGTWFDNLFGNILAFNKIKWASITPMLLKKIASCTNSSYILFEQFLIGL